MTSRRNQKKYAASFAKGRKMRLKSGGFMQRRVATLFRETREFKRNGI